MKTKINKHNVSKKKITESSVKRISAAVVEPKHLFIKAAGLNDGKWGITLSDGSLLDGVEEILQTKPSYSDGFTVTAKIFIPFKDKKITKDA